MDFYHCARYICHIRCILSYYLHHIRSKIHTALTRNIQNRKWRPRQARNVKCWTRDAKLVFYLVFQYSNSIRYLGPLIWNTLPLEIRTIESLHEFKKVIRRWKPTHCPCRLCKMYIHNLGFVSLFSQQAISLCC